MQSSLDGHVLLAREASIFNCGNPGLVNEFRDYTRAGGCLNPIYGIVQPYSLGCRYLCNEEQLEGKSGR